MNVTFVFRDRGSLRSKLSKRLDRRHCRWSDGIALPMISVLLSISTAAPVPAAGCSFAINFINSPSGASSVLTCPYVQAGAKYRASFSGTTVQADGVVTLGRFSLGTSGPPVEIKFKVEKGTDGKFLWTAPGVISRSGVVGPQGAVATLKFEEEGCLNNNDKINCGLHGTLVIDVISP